MNKKFMFCLGIAWAYYKKIYTRSLLGIMVIIAVSGICIGVASLLVTLSVMNGFQSEITEKLMMMNPHLFMIYAGSTPSPEGDRQTMKDISGIREIRSSGRVVYGKGIAYFRKQSQGVVIKGVEGGRLNVPLAKGKFEPGTVVIGKELASALIAGPGDEIVIMVPNLKDMTASMIPRMEKLKVSAVFSSGLYEYDSSLVFIDLAVAEKILAGNSTTSGIEVYTLNPYRIENTAALIRKTVEKYTYSIMTWQEKNHNLFAALKLEKTMMFLVLAMIVIVATFNIAGTLIMLTVTRSKDCGILRAIGATKNNIKVIFNLNGLFIGMTGTVLGLGAGTVISWLVGKYRFIKLPPGVYPLTTLPVNMKIADVISIAAVAILISYLATLYPAIRAGKMKVTEELKYE